MSTSTQVDQGDYIETITGEPTWDNPTVWRSSSIDWKPGTTGAILAQAQTGLSDAAANLQPGLTQAQADLANWATYSAEQKDQAIQRVIGDLSMIAQAVANLAVLVGHLPTSVLSG